MGRNIIDMVTTILFFALVSVVAITITLTAWCAVLTLAAIHIIKEKIEDILFNLSKLMKLNFSLKIKYFKSYEKS
jgi:hypothetical protein